MGSNKTGLSSRVCIWSGGRRGEGGKEGVDEGGLPGKLPECSNDCSSAGDAREIRGEFTHDSHSRDLNALRPHTFVLGSFVLDSADLCCKRYCWEIERVDTTFTRRRKKTKTGAGNHMFCMVDACPNVSWGRCPKQEVAVLTFGRLFCMTASARGPSSLGRRSQPHRCRTVTIACASTSRNSTNFSNSYIHRCAVLVHLNLCMASFQITAP